MKHTELYQKLVREWSDRNDRPLDSYKSNSKAKGWWICPKGHEWEATIKGRFSGHGCPFCGRRKPIPGENDAATLRPELVQEWHPVRNEEHKLSDFGGGSEYLAWWVCSKGHEWKASINHRVRGQGCPFCKKRVPHPEDNLATALPHVAALWDYEKNTERPEDFRPHSGKTVWWKCKKGHEWHATIQAMSRVKATNGCPYCSGKLPIKGETDLETLHPELVLEWDYEKNTKAPSEYTASSNKVVHWICPRGHRYSASITNRTKGRGCSLCNRGWKANNNLDRREQK